MLSSTAPNSIVQGRVAEWRVTSPLESNRGTDYDWRSLQAVLLSHKLLTGPTGWAERTHPPWKTGKDDVTQLVCLHVCLCHGVWKGVSVCCRRSGATVWVWPPLSCQHIKCPQSPPPHQPPPPSICLALSFLFRFPQSQGVTETLLVRLWDL